MPTLERPCFLCGETVMLISESPGPYGLYAGQHGRIICDPCVEARQIAINESDVNDRFIPWPDGDEFGRIAGAWVGSPSRNPESKRYQDHLVNHPTAPTVAGSPAAPAVA